MGTIVQFGCDQCYASYEQVIFIIYYDIIVAK
jgi:protein-arginine kinase activator protein McsA